MWVSTVELGNSFSDSSRRQRVREQQVRLGVLESGSSVVGTQGHSPPFIPRGFPDYLNPQDGYIYIFFEGDHQYYLILILNINKSSF